MTTNESIAAVRGKMIRPGDEGGAQGLEHVASYERRLGGSVERLLENALDWEHLPWLHDSSFAWIKRQESGDWGWRARLGLPSTEEPQEILLELLLDHEGQAWVSRVLEGTGAGNEIWSHTVAVDDRTCDVFVEFHLANVIPVQAESYGKAYQRLYARLYDEDEGMMIGRQEQLDRLRASKSEAPERLVLGTIEDVKARLPLLFEYGGHPFRLVEFEGRLLAHSTVCTHYLGPLDHCAVEEGGIVTCPWHGCTFDICTGKSADKNNFKLQPAPRVEVDDATGEVVASQSS